MLLPSIPSLIDRCKALAALDLILAPNWRPHFFSFNARWSPSEMMASLRDGGGNEWWLVFHGDGWAALKGWNRESPAWNRHQGALATALQRAFPADFKEFANEPAFTWNKTSFAYLHPIGASSWTRLNDLVGDAAEDAGEASLLAHLMCDPASYAAFASDYYETKVDAETVARIFALHPITAALVNRLNPSIAMADIAEELYSEIQYPNPIEVC
jgi:hypothetical protein